ncbi:hypothetical protein FA95DRAFT_223256 [Auriscalpium vulgare]|uniref:Uncharacterized protein n=1 Tax=Auriscalpium vulgare TaxID=40419 RepID=A0ACB8RL94_9AGAM|nr:hypothetical protein FA95DRAFT_223256 [Auriscalpium vulgare]
MKALCCALAFPGCSCVSFLPWNDLLVNLTFDNRKDDMDPAVDGCRGYSSRSGLNGHIRLPRLVHLRPRRFYPQRRAVRDAQSAKVRARGFTFCRMTG